MKRWILTAACFLVLALAAAVSAQDAAPAPSAPAPGAGVKLSADNVFFTEPYINLVPPVHDLIAMSLELDYAYIKYPYGFVNTVDPSQPEISYRKRIVITDKDQLARLKEKSGLAAGDRVTVVSAQGLAWPARIESFSYVGNSPSTIIVAADLRMEGDADPSVFSRHGIAFKGALAIGQVRKVFAGKALDRTDSLAQKLVHLCAADLPAGHIIQDARAVPAYLEADASGYYFVSYWERPDPDFEIEDVQLKSCLFRPVGEGFARAEMPMPLAVEQVYDLNQDGKAEIFGLTGDGAEVCYVFLAPKGAAYSLVKKGLCAGY
ncbi:MAG TPA: hypothetical protein VM658_21105 [bacterium]|nr:hypothetical protein [bacterium]